jgi:hypothetical protein
VAYAYVYAYMCVVCVDTARQQHPDRHTRGWAQAAQQPTQKEAHTHTHTHTHTLLEGGGGGGQAAQRVLRRAQAAEALGPPGREGHAGLCVPQRLAHAVQPHVRGRAVAEVDVVVRVHTDGLTQHNTTHNTTQYTTHTVLSNSVTQTHHARPMHPCIHVSMHHGVRQRTLHLPYPIRCASARVCVVTCV